jgi:renin receptor
MSNLATYLVILLVTVVSSVFSSEHLIVTHAPDYLHFMATGEHIPLSEVPSLISTTFGYSLKKDLSWSGLTQDTLFKRPKANVLISIDGFQDKSLDLNVHHIARYPTYSDDVNVNTELVGDKLQSSFQKPLIVDFSADNTVFDVKSAHPEVFSGLTSTLDKIKEVLSSGNSHLDNYNLGTLNTSEQADVQLLGELQLIHEIIQALYDKPETIQNKSPDMFHFRVGGLNALVQVHGSKSDKVKDAINLLRNFLTKVTDDFKALYKGNVVVEVVTLSGIIKPLSRRARNLLQSEKQSFQREIKLTGDYDPEYEAMFNIILWTMIVLVLVILAIAVGIWNMDPGRDSIIYRMTTQRIKKD